MRVWIEQTVLQVHILIESVSIGVRSLICQATSAHLMLHCDKHNNVLMDDAVASEIQSQANSRQCLTTGHGCELPQVVSFVAYHTGNCTTIHVFVAVPVALITCEQRWSRLRAYQFYMCL